MTVRAMRLRFVFTLALLLLMLFTATATAQLVRGVPYGTGSEETATIFPSATAGSPTVVFVHGGWWGEQMQETADEKQMLQVQAAGLTVVDIRYPQIPRPRHPFPVETEAVERAVWWAHGHAQEYNGNPANVELFGSSAGGTLASQAAERLDAVLPGTVAGVMELSAPGMDFVSLVSLLQNEEGPVSGDVPVEKATECPQLEDCSEAREREWSPVFNIPIACPPWFLAYGLEADFIPASQQIEMQQALEAAGCQSELVAAPRGHAIAYFHEIKPQILTFLQAH
jgi:acetyl esterase/lipase